MLSIITKDTGENVKCSITGKPTLQECISAVSCVVKVFKTCIPDEPDAVLAVLLGDVVARELTEEAVDNEQI